MIKAITFDLDGVYFLKGWPRLFENLAKLGIPDEEARQVVIKSGEMKQYKTGRLSDDQFWTWAINEWGLNKSPQELIELFLSGYETDDRVVDIVKKVRANGYKSLVCSNNFPARVNGLQQKFHFLENFDTTVFSYEVGATKPSEIIFSELIKRAGVPAETIVFSDDNPANLTGAQSLGITTFLYEGFDKFLEQLKNLGVKI